MTTLRADLFAHARLTAELVRELGPLLDASHHRLVDELFRRYDALDTRLANLPLASSVGIEPPHAAAAPPGPRYDAVVAEVQAFVASLPDPGRVCVVTRGDRALVEAGTASARHFPHDEFGAWAGHHPAHGADAVARLEAAVRAGATHLVLPATSRWWLDYYTELREHLSAARVVRDDAHLTAWAIASLPVGVAHASTPESTRYAGQVRHFVSLAGAVVPPGAHLAVVSRGDDALLGVAGAIGTHFPSDTDGTYLGHPVDDDDALRLLHDAIERGARFLGLPAPLSWWCDTYAGFVDRLDVEHRRLVDRPGVGVVYELNPPSRQTEGSPR